MATRKYGIFIFRNILWPSGSSQTLVSHNISVLLFIVMVGLRSTHYSSFASYKKSFGPTDSSINLTLLFQHLQPMFPPKPFD